MINELEKSDSPTVAAKLPNKSTRMEAEAVEPRGGAKGNTGELNRRRTLGRGSVSQRLDRVRRAARSRKKERFTALLHHIDVDLLRQAYFWLKKKAAPGVDGVTWEEYGKDLEAKLKDCTRAFTATPIGHNRRRGNTSESEWTATPTGHSSVGG